MDFNPNCPKVHLEVWLMLPGTNEKENVLQSHFERKIWNWNGYFVFFLKEFESFPSAIEVYDIFWKYH